MKLSLFFFVLLLLIGCGKPSETQDTQETQDSTQAYEATTDSGASEESAGTKQLEHFLATFKIAEQGYPSVTFSYGNEFVSHRVTYFFEEDNMMWLEIAHSEEGGIAENHVVGRDPEGDYFLHYGLDMDGTFGYESMDGGEWYVVKADGNYEPYIVGPGQDGKFEFLPDFKETMNVVRTNKDKFLLEDGYYVFKQQQGNRPVTYKFSEALFGSNVLANP